MSLQSTTAELEITYLDAGNVGNSLCFRHRGPGRPARPTLDLPFPSPNRPSQGLDRLRCHCLQYWRAGLWFSPEEADAWVKRAYTRGFV
jgi:hypothetical protein